jgi:adenylate kinase
MYAKRNFMTRLVISGNPGVGKHSTAKLIINKISGAKILDINKIAIEFNTILKKDSKYGIDVNIKKLNRIMAHKLKSEESAHLIVIGHLAPYVLKSSQIDLAVILRRSPYKLVTTFRKRKYPIEKIRENVASEILGVSFYDALQTFGRDKITELDTTNKVPEDVAQDIILFLEGKKTRKIDAPDWLSLIYEKGDLNKFFEY